MRLRQQAVIAVAALCVAGASPALRGASPSPTADDLILTDGKKITGTIVGMDKGSFRVETDYGIALVRKDKVVRIDVTKVEPPPPPVVAPTPAPIKPAAPPASAAARPGTVQERRPPNGKIDEHVENSVYFNDTFGFQMFKPLNWKVLDDTARSIPSAVAALGMEDESSIVIVGTVRFDGPESAYANMLATALKKIYADYEAQPGQQIEIAGFPAIRGTFHGSANGRDWHGMVVNLADGDIHYGIIGVTNDENYQFKTTVLNKMVNSFRFTASKPK